MDDLAFRLRALDCLGGHAGRGYDKEGYFPSDSKAAKKAYADAVESFPKPLGYWVETEANSFIYLISSQSSENTHRQNRYFVRAFRGVSCGVAKVHRFRWFVLTESDEAIAEHISFGKEFRYFVTWLRYYCPDFQYLVVEHRQGTKLRRNWHIISYGSDKLPVLAMREYWLKRFKSTVTGMAEIRDISRSIYYLATYLDGQDKFVRSWSSQGWVFKGWLKFSKEYQKRYGIYPSSDELVELAKQPNEGRDTELLLETGYRTSDELESCQGSLQHFLNSLRHLSDVK